MSTLLEIALRVAWKFVGTFYRWGGDDPSGFDCSGLAIEILKSVGFVPRNYDSTAQGIYNKFRDKEVSEPSAGCFIFWSVNGKIVHIEFCINETHTIGASGGGSSTTSIEAAEKQNAYVKVRPIREGYSNIINPFL